MQLSNLDTLYLILNGEENNRSEYFKKVEKFIRKLTKWTMHALRILTYFGSPCEKSWQGRKIVKNKTDNSFVLVNPQIFISLITVFKTKNFQKNCNN